MCKTLLSHVCLVEMNVNSKNSVGTVVNVFAQIRFVFFIVTNVFALFGFRLIYNVIIIIIVQSSCTSAGTCVCLQPVNLPGGQVARATDGTNKIHFFSFLLENGLNDKLTCLFLKKIPCDSLLQRSWNDKRRLW